MRLKKLTVAIMAASAMMAATVVPTTAFADDLVDETVVSSEELDPAGSVDDTLIEDEQVTAQTNAPATEAPTTEAVKGPGKVVDGSVTFSFDSTAKKGYVTFTLVFDDETKDTRTVEAHECKHFDATCTEPEKYVYDYEIAGVVYGNDEKSTFSVGEKKGHTWTTKDVVIVPATCAGQPLKIQHDATGKKQWQRTCSTCGTTEYSADGETWVTDSSVGYEYTEKVQHKLGESYTEIFTAEATDGDTVVTKTVTDENGKEQTIEAKNTKKNADGTVTLIDSGMEGYYYVLTYADCSACGGKFLLGTEKKTIYGANLDTAVVVDQYNIYLADGKEVVTGETTYNALKDLTDTDYILNDCSKDGTITFRYTDRNGRQATKKITIKAHHSPSGDKFIVGKTKADDLLLSAYYDKNGKLQVVSTSCVNPAEYVEFDLCKSPDCPNKKELTGVKGLYVNTTEHTVGDRAYPMSAYYTDDVNGGGQEQTVELGYATKSEKVAVASGDHTVKTALVEAVEKAINEYNAKVAAYTADTINAHYNDYTDLKKTLDDIAKQYNVNGKTEIKIAYSYDCEKGGSVVITYVCTVCGKDVTDRIVTVKVPAYGHQWPADYVIENEVKPTCTSNGSYDEVKYCTVCKAELERKNVTILSVAHNYGTPVLGFSGGVVVDYLDANGPHINVGDTYTVGELVGGRYSLSVIPTMTVSCKDCGYTINLQAETEVKDGKTTYTGKISGVDNKGHKESFEGYVATVTALTRDTYDKTTDKVQPGKITLTATYGEITETDTFNYYSSGDAYANREKSTDAKNGLTLDSDNVFRYYRNGKLDTDYTGIVEYNGGKFMVDHGVVRTDWNGIHLVDADNEFYWFANGQVQEWYTGLAWYPDETSERFYVVKGKVDLNANGIRVHDGSKFVVAVGRYVREYTGLYEDPETGKAYHVIEGQVYPNYTGDSQYGEHVYHLVNGKITGVD